jgi:hypothetical protein
MNSNPTTTTIITDLTGEVTAEEQAAILDAIANGFACGFRGGLEDGAYSPGFFQPVTRIGWLGMLAPTSLEVGTVLLVSIGVTRKYRTHFTADGWVVDGRVILNGHVMLDGRPVTDTLVSA